MSHYTGIPSTNGFTQSVRLRVFPKTVRSRWLGQRQTEVPVIGALSYSVVQVPLPLGSGFRGSYIKSFGDRPSYSPRWILLWQDVHTGTCFLFRIAITRVNPFEPRLVKPCLTCRTWCIAIPCVSPHITQGHPSFDLVRRRTFIRIKSTSGESVKAPLLIDQSVFLKNVIVFSCPLARLTLMLMSFPCITWVIGRCRLAASVLARLNFRIYCT